MKMKELKIEEMVEINGGRRGRGFFDGRGIREIHDYSGASFGRSDRDYTPSPDTPEGRRRTATRP